MLKPELLDTLPPERARKSLADLIRLNKYWGGHSVLRKLLAEVAPRGERFTLLDIGAASGDMAACARAMYPGASVTSLDCLDSHLAAAPSPKLAGDAFRLPFRPASFDFVFCSLFLHHFPDEQVAQLLGGFGTAARRAVLVIDLDRHPIPYYFVPATRWLFGWDPVTVNDAPISVEAGFRKRELVEAARAAGLRDVRVRLHFPGFRISMIATPGTR